jgi:hypothetical protein
VTFSDDPLTDDWQPATSKPGELLTPEGEFKAAAAVLRNLKHSDPRGKRYRRGMQRTAWAILGVAVAILVVVLAVQAAL